MGKKKNQLFSIIYIAITIIIIILILVFGPSIEEMREALKNFNKWWFLSTIAALLLYWFSDAVLLDDITAYMYKREPLHRSIKVSLIGLYYSALTPSSTGGQPMQVIYMHRNKMPVGTASCIVGIKFVIYELSLCTIYIVGLLLRGEYFYTYHNEAFWLGVLGFFINLAAVVIIILSIIKKTLVLNIGKKLLNLLERIKLIKHKEQLTESFEKVIEEYHTAATYILKNKLRTIGSYLISTINLVFMLLIPYLIYLSFGYNTDSIFDIFIIETFLFLAVSFVPLPGAAGASEGGFLLFFSPFFGVTTSIAMLIWRFMTYYLIIIVGSLVVVGDEMFTMHRKKKELDVDGISG